MGWLVPLDKTGRTQHPDYLSGTLHLLCGLEHLGYPPAISSKDWRRGAGQVVVICAADCGDHRVAEPVEDPIEDLDSYTERHRGLTEIRGGFGSRIHEV